MKKKLAKEIREYAKQLKEEGYKHDSFGRTKRGKVNHARRLKRLLKRNDEEGVKEYIRKRKKAA